MFAGVRFVAGAVCFGLVFGTSKVQGQAAGEEDDASLFDEIVVTARHRSESLQDVGQSVGVVDGSAVSAAGIVDFADVARRLPGLDFADRGPNRNEFSIRGVSRAVPLTDGIPTPNLVASYFDEIPVNTPGTSQRDLPLFDINRVEVLRGPQGTLFGEGAMGGAIRSFSNDPDLESVAFKFDGTFAQTSGSDGDDVRLNAMLNVPITETFAIRAAVFSRDEAGFIDNLSSGQSDINDFESIGGRLTALYEPTDRLRIRASYMIDEYDQGASWSINSPDDRSFQGYTTLRPPPDERTDDLTLANLKIDYDFGRVSLSSITGLYERDDDRLRFNAPVTGLFQGLVGPVLQGLAAIPVAPPDGIDPSLVPAINALAQVSANSTQRRFEEHLVQEFRLVSNFDGSVNFVAGVFYRDINWRDTQSFPMEEIEPFSGVPYFAETRGDFDGQQHSVYAEVDWDLNDRWTLTTGLRWYDESITTDLPADVRLGVPTFFGNFGAIQAGLLPPSAILEAFGAFDQSELGLESDFDVLLPKAAVEYHASDDLLFFGSISKGARNGYVNSGFSTASILVLDPATGLVDPQATAAAQADASVYEPDEIVAYELGAKSTLADGRLNLNAGIYYNDWSDLQMQFFAAVNNTPYINNAGDARTVGAEVEFYFQANDNFALYGGVNFVEAELSEDVVLQDTGIDPVTGVPVFLDTPEVARKGDTLPYVPDYTANLGAEFFVPVTSALQLHVRGDYLYTASAVGLLQTQQELESYGLLNLRIGLTGERWTASLFANNLTDENLVLATNRPSAGQPTELFVNRPRQVGLQVSFQY